MQPLIEGGAAGAGLPEEIRALLGPDLAAKFGRAGGGLLLRPAKLADKCRPLLAMLANFTGEETRLARELVALMRSGEALVGVSDWGKDALDWELAWIPAAAQTDQNQANPAPAGQAQ